MIIKSLKLRNFRNYESLYMTFDPHLNVFTGENAQGKTNLLESLVYLSLTRSHRIADDKKLIRDQMPFADIRCVCEENGKQKEMEAVIHPKGKTLLVHHQPVSRSSEFVGILNTVLFAPDDLRLFSDSPKDRRRMMNQEITKVSSAYLLSLNRFQSFLKERNLILKRPEPDVALLDTLDVQMAKEEAVIIEMRKHFVDTLNQYMRTMYQKIAGEDCDVAIVYRCCNDSFGQEDILKKHQEYRKKDIDSRVTSFGIHREDILFTMKDRPITDLASQGQKRMVMLAFKLSLLEYIRSMTGKEPVLLLDDVLSELDQTRQKRLLSLVSSPYQCMITATEVPSFLKNKKITEFHIENGIIHKL